MTTELQQSWFGPDRARHLPFAVLVLLVVIAGIELVFLAADLRLIEPARLRLIAYENGAFWSGLLRGWMPNYPLQPITMFGTYAILHSGFGHMLGNALTIFLLGGAICERIGQRGFVWICMTSAFGGGLGFALLNQATQPMVGTSGVVFGLAGGLTAYLWNDSSDDRIRIMSRMIGIAVLLAILNLVTWWALDGLLAWETHLGGFVAGFATVLALPRHRRRARKTS